MSRSSKEGEKEAETLDDKIENHGLNLCENKTEIDSLKLAAIDDNKPMEVIEELTRNEEKQTKESDINHEKVVGIETAAKNLESSSNLEQNNHMEIIEKPSQLGVLSMNVIDDDTVSQREDDEIVNESDMDDNCMDVNKTLGEGATPSRQRRSLRRLSLNKLNGGSKCASKSPDRSNNSVLLNSSEDSDLDEVLKEVEKTSHMAEFKMISESDTVDNDLACNLGDNSFESDSSLIYDNENSFNCGEQLSPTSIVITPKDLPPSREEVEMGWREINMPEYQFPEPYYSDSNDIGKKREVGCLVLKIPGNKLNDLEEFSSILGEDLQGLCAWRKNQYLNLRVSSFGVDLMKNILDNLNKINASKIREYFAKKQKAVVITPLIAAPSKHDVKLWLKAKELLRKKDNSEKMCSMDEQKDNQLEDASDCLYEIDSPIKIRRQKVTMVMTAMTEDVTDQEKGIGNATTITEIDSTIFRNLDSDETTIHTEDVLAELERSSFRKQMEDSDSRTSSTLLHDTTILSNLGYKIDLENLKEAKTDVEV